MHTASDTLNRIWLVPFFLRRHKSPVNAVYALVRWSFTFSLLKYTSHTRNLSIPFWLTAYSRLKWFRQICIPSRCCAIFAQWVCAKWWCSIVLYKDRWYLCLTVIHMLAFDSWFDWIDCGEIQSMRWESYLIPCVRLCHKVSVSEWKSNIKWHIIKLSLIDVVFCVYVRAWNMDIHPMILQE